MFFSQKRLTIRSQVRRICIKTCKFRIRVVIAVLILFVFFLVPWARIFYPYLPYPRPESMQRLLSDDNFNLTRYVLSQPTQVCGSLPNRSFHIDIDTWWPHTSSRLPSVTDKLSSFKQSKPTSGDSKKLRTIAFVISSPTNTESRDAIRATWAAFAAQNDQVRTLFVLGRPKDRLEWNRLQSEQQEHADLLIFPFVDSYYTMVCKSVAILRWMLENCVDAEYVIKVDDDVLINWPLLNSTLTELRSLSNPIVIGQKRTNQRPNRNSNSRWFIDHKSYPNDYFPTFVSGPMYVLNRAAAQLIMNVFGRVTPIYLEDVFVTGLLRQQVPNVWLLEPQPHLADLLIPACAYRRYHALHKCTAQDMTRQWKYFQFPNQIDCNSWSDFFINQFVALFY